MLREVVNQHIKPRIIPFRTTQNSGGASVLMGYGDITASRPSEGVLSVTLRDYLSRNGLIFGTQRGGGDGGYVGNADATGKSSVFGLNGYDSVGNLTDCSIDGFIFGWDNSDTSITKVQRVVSVTNFPRIMWGKVTGATGAVAAGTGDFSCTRSAAGTYSITFKRPFKQAPVVAVTAIATSAASSPQITLAPTARTATGTSFTLAPSSGTAADADFYLVVIGQDTRSDSGRNRDRLQNSQRKPRIVAGQITNASGAWSLSIGGATGGADFTTVTDNGAGDVSVTLTTPFKREPAIILSSTTQRSQVHSYSAGVIRILTKDATDTNTDVDGVTNIFCIGSDDASEY